MICVAIAFLFGVVTTVYLSLRSPEVKVPDVVGKDRFEAEKILGSADLNFRVRATRPSNQAKPDTVLFQLPRAGEVVKAGQTVAMDVSRAAKEGETPETVKPEEPADKPKVDANTNANENKTKRPKTVNKNDSENDNSNANTKHSVNVNRSTNVNRSANNSNANTATHSNVNRPINSSSPATTNQNVNRRPAVPRTSPTVSNVNRQVP